MKLGVWRLLELEVRDAFANMAIDEAIVSARTEWLVPNTLRFYRWNPSAVSVGRFQDVSNEVNVENCRRHGVDIVRRISGGGAVYHDHEGEITYSVVVNEKDLEGKDFVSAYKMICNGLIEAASILGIQVDFRPGDPKRCPNITINGKKISGSSQYRGRSVLLQHGTFLVELKLEKMFRFLKVPWAKCYMDVLPLAEKRLTSVKRELGSDVTMEEVYQALIAGFEKALQIHLVKRDLSSYEQTISKKLLTEKFVTEDWNFKSRI